MHLHAGPRVSATRSRFAGGVHEVHEEDVTITHGVATTHDVTITHGVGTTHDVTITHAGTKLQHHTRRQRHNTTLQHAAAARTSQHSPA